MFKVHVAACKTVGIVSHLTVSPRRRLHGIVSGKNYHFDFKLITPQGPWFPFGLRGLTWGERHIRTTPAWRTSCGVRCIGAVAVQAAWPKLGGEAMVRIETRQPKRVSVGRSSRLTRSESEPQSTSLPSNGIIANGEVIVMEVSVRQAWPQVLDTYAAGRNAVSMLHGEIQCEFAAEVRTIR